MQDLEPVHLHEDESTGDRFLIYADGTGVHIEVNYEGSELWMTQAQIAALYGRDVSTISRHIASIIDEGELDEATSLQKAQTSHGRPATLYSLDMVISVGYRVASKQATLFRKWSTQTLVQFATKGFVIDVPRLKSPENRDRIAELKEIIREIRSDEANVYRELRSICAMCQDYDGKSDEWHEFYRNTQAKLIYAVCSHTPAELLQLRADSRQPNMGLQAWPNENIRKADVGTSKLLGRGRDQGIEPAYDDFARYFRRPNGLGPIEAHGRNDRLARRSVIWPRAGCLTRRRHGQNGKREGFCRAPIREIQGSTKAA